MKTDYLLLFKKFKKYKILVVGDFILDVYLEGNCTRLAPEASVPVVDIVSKKHCLGGAANAAANLSALGAKVFLCTVTGNDAGLDQSARLLESAGISRDYMVADPKRSTLVKTRVTSPSHTLVRFDEGTDSPLETDAETAFIERLHQAYFQCDAVLIADYNKGTLTPTVISEIKKLKLMADKFIAVDAKRAEAFAEIAPALVKPNYDEAIRLLALPYSSESRADQLKPFGEHFQKRTNASLVALTMDKDGALFFEDGKFVHRGYARKVINPNVSGAGDTYISALMLSLIAGAALPVAADLASAAASIAIARADTAICQANELLDAVTTNQKYVSLLSQFRQKCRAFKSEGKRIVFTNGCFDILHSGHVSYLKQAREMGDLLVVGLNNDESIRRLKGSDRPINSLDNRIEVLAALEFVDYIIPFGNLRDDTPVSLIRLVKPDVFVKGGDYQGKALPEEALLRKIGCKIEFLPFVSNQSTTQIINRVRKDGHLKIAVIN
ncbi:D-glycero-beta-D-manno-heptose 1-phosphate adenylyltransferase [Pedobacter deserti]|uniref:D-glycero-beta-D-manno-heptose 1-phosphate adenylyltransferase n=1 Tax=Pedobacter deserti TaxID=2817382 RepID=UPI002108A7AE|nr:D-glycero-beta-D-manno-heptose 1-phosphate adenylyltransferase [Pedobacter sp. SYSU D00382]